MIFEGATSVAIQSDGRIVAAGGTFNAPTQVDFAVARYNTDGSLDATFDGDGRVTTPLGPVGFARSPASRFNLTAVSSRSVSRRSISGWCATTPTDRATRRLAAVPASSPRISAAGVMKGRGWRFSLTASSWRSDARRAAPTSRSALQQRRLARCVVRQRRPRAHRLPRRQGRRKRRGAAGRRKDHRDRRYNAGGNANDDFAVARYDTSGALDLTFGGGSGVSVTDVGSSADDPRGVAIQRDGRILVVGQTAFGAAIGVSDFVIIRYEGPMPHDLTFFLRGDDVPVPRRAPTR